MGQVRQQTHDDELGRPNTECGHSECKKGFTHSSHCLSYAATDATAVRCQASTHRVKA
jgi:hypothetical protein